MNSASFYRSPRHRCGKGFTLVEMLTVVAIITILVALTAPVLVDVVRSTRLSSAGDSLLNRISLAQQSAIALSSEVELRFYKYTDDNSDRPGAAAFYGYQVVHDQGAGRPLRALSEPYYLESGIILSDVGELSPLLQTTNPQADDESGRFLFTPTAAGVQPDQVEYAALRFYPDGSCRALDDGGEDDGGGGATASIVPNLQQSFLTLVESRFADAGAPTNYYCIQVDSYTGKTRVYRP